MAAETPWWPTESESAAGVQHLPYKNLKAFPIYGFWQIFSGFRFLNKNLKAFNYWRKKAELKVGLELIYMYMVHMEKQW